MNTRQENEIVHNRSIASRADKVWGRTGLTGRLRVERRAKTMIELAGIGPGKQVLEIGCGTGELTARLALTGAEITASDLDEGFLSLAREKAFFPNVKFEEAVGESLENFGPETFDVVCGLSILHHLDVDAAVRNIYRVLKSKGAAVFSEPNMANPQILLQKNIPWLKKLAGDSPDETAFFRGPLRRFFVSAGFKEVEVWPFDFLHPALPDSTAVFFERCGRWLEKIPFIREVAGSLFIFAKK